MSPCSLGVIKVELRASQQLLECRNKLQPHIILRELVDARSFVMEKAAAGDIFGDSYRTRLVVSRSHTAPGPNLISPLL